MSKTSILIVEDQAIIAYDLASKVKQLGYDVAGITDTGEEAIELVRLHRPALVLMDVQLAGAMDGIAAAQQIHREFNLPVLFLTANFGIWTDERARLAGSVECILKPFDKREIRLQIEKALQNASTE
jgi:CheY-like chemotaxis protein